MTTVARLSADLSASQGSFETGMRRAAGVVTNSQRQMQQSMSRTQSAFNNFDAGIRSTVSNVIDLRAAALTLTGAFSAQKIIAYSDQYRSLSGRLKLATRDAEEFRTVNAELFRLAQANGTPLEANIEAYARLSSSLTNAQKAQYDMVRVTDILSKTLVISGTSSQNASELIRQFGQAASSDFKGVAQEINSFQDQAPRLAKLLQDSLGKGGKSLKKMAQDGELSTGAVVKAILDMGEVIDKETAQMGDSVGKALTRLDNAFLNFVGNSDAVNKGTSSIAVGINTLAKNFDLLASGVVLLGGLFLARLIPAYASAITSAAALRVATVTETAALNAATVAAAGNARVTAAMAKAQTAAAGSMSASTIVVGNTGKAVVAATTAMGAFTAGAGMLARGLLAAVGGPIGLAITAFTLLALRTTDAEKAQQQHMQTMNRVSEVATKLATATGRSADNLKRERDELITNAQAKVKNAQATLALLQVEASRLNSTNAYTVAKTGVSPKNGPVTSEEQSGIAAAAGQLAQAKKDLMEIEDTFAQSRVFGPTAGVETELSKAAKKRIEDTKDLLNSLRKESESVQLQVDMYGQKAGAIARAQRQMEVDNTIREKGLKLDRDQNAELQTSLENIERQTDALKTLEDAQKKAEEAEKRRLDALADYGYAFQSSFEDAITELEDLRSVLSSLAKDIAKIALRSATAPMISGLGEWFGSKLTSWLPSFAVGSSYVPSDMVANIHKGEMIIPAKEASAIRNGSSRGGEFVANINISGGGGGDPRETARVIEQQLDGWWNEKMRNSMRPGNILNPVF